MVMLARDLQHVAAAVTRRAAELLSTRVWVLDEHGITVASSDPRTVGLPFTPGEPQTEADFIRFGIELDGQASEVVFAQLPGDESISPRLAQELIELLINQTTLVERLPNQHELKNKFIHDLLRGPIADESDVKREGQILGMDLSRPRAVILVDASHYILSQRGPVYPERGEALTQRSLLRTQLVIASIVNFFQLPDETICAYIGDGEIVVLKASSTQDLVAWTKDDEQADEASPSWANLTALKRAGSALLARLKRDTNSAINVGIGRYHPGIGGLARSYQDARAALSLGRRFHGQNQVHCLDGLGVAAFVGVADERTKVDLATHLLSPLDHEPELLQTLDAFFCENCCPSTTAARLSVHRNTLTYRLSKISFLTGLDPRQFDDALQIRLALVVRSLAA
jgi:carbohydrate diacid regulator